MRILKSCRSTVTALRRFSICVHVHWLRTSEPYVHGRDSLSCQIYWIKCRASHGEKAKVPSSCQARIQPLNICLISVGLQRSARGPVWLTRYTRLSGHPPDRTRKSNIIGALEWRGSRRGVKTDFRPGRLFALVRFREAGLTERFVLYFVMDPFFLHWMFFVIILSL